MKHPGQIFKFVQILLAGTLILAAALPLTAGAVFQEQIGLEETEPFVDVQPQDYFYQPVVWATKNQVTSGRSDTLFAPHSSCTRAEAVTFLWRAAGKPEAKIQISPFTDVTEEDFCFSAILWAAEQGITKGINEQNFAPGMICSRAQIVTFLYAYLGKPVAPGEIPFTDVPPDAYFRQAVAWAAAEDITEGISKKTFAPYVDCSRAQILTFLFRGLNPNHLTTLYTADKAGVYAQPSLNSERTAELNPRTRVMCVEQENGWWTVLYQGQLCYIPAQYLVKKTQLPPEPSFLIVLDPGHQRRGNFETEPIGPGAKQKKPKVSSGTASPFTGFPEYQLNLDVSLQLRDELERRGYEVLMIRTTNDVNISNAERAAIANQHHADAMIRIHADGSNRSSLHGASTICQTPNNPYNKKLYPKCKALSVSILDELVAATGCKKRMVWETDTMSGINWCQVPVTIVEMGFMTNRYEDALLSRPDYQHKIVLGIANGIDRFLK